MSSPFCLPSSTTNFTSDDFRPTKKSGQTLAQSNPGRCRATHKRSFSDNAATTTPRTSAAKERDTLAVLSSPFFRAHQPHQASSSANSSHLMIPSPSSIGGTSASSSMSKSRIFPSTRFFIALLLCFCYVSIGISTSNISSAIICMVRNDSHKLVSLGNAPIGTTPTDDLLGLRRRRSDDVSSESQKVNESSSLLSPSPDVVLSSLTKPLPHPECDHRRARRDSQIYRQTCQEAEKLPWTSTEQGLVFAGQNAGSLLMLFTGRQADRLNSKWTIVAALFLLIVSNSALPFVAPIHFLLAVLARVLTGVSDALLQPSTSSLITRWFPPKERPFAIGLITGGRQIGTILINPLSGWICDQSVNNPDGRFAWHTVFFVSAVIGLSILLAWLLLSADKPSKHFCTSIQERFFVEKKIADEKLGKRTEKRPIPWAHLARCKPFYAGVAALICHEYPLVIMLQLLSKYINDVYDGISYTTNGLLSAMPIAILFASKTLSASLASFIQSRKKGRFVIGRTPLVKLFNGIASLGLGVCVILVPMMNQTEHNHMALFFICLANAFAGLHTPGVQTALLQIAPAFTGIITGIAFGCVAVASICNKVISSTIITDGSIKNWALVFWISGVIALLPVVFFTIWGSADRQPWASMGKKQPSTRRRSGRKNTAKVSPMAEDKRGAVETNNTASMYTIGCDLKMKTVEEEEKEECRRGRTEEEECRRGRAEEEECRRGRAVEEECRRGRVEEEECRRGRVEEEEEEGDDGSAHYEAEAAVASALRLQMYLEDPEGQNLEEEEDEEEEMEEAQTEGANSNVCENKF
uniref:MFS domain-containing protein n=1 Tax=Globodera pallida TaxID=36090 RepID=A0A183CDJ1_GLOPA